MESIQKTRVVVADDQRFARMYADMQIKTSPRYEIVASLPSADDAAAFFEYHDADLVVLDVVMERGRDGLAVAARIKQKCPEVKIILCTSMAETAWMEKARALGVESFWYKEYSRLSLIEIMDRTMDGETVYSDEVPEAYLGELAVSTLSERQKDILRCMIAGLTNREIAETLYLSHNTVKSYVNELMELSGLHSRTELAVRASKLGLSVNKS